MKAVVLFVALCVAFSLQDGQPKLKVTVYYETLCGDSKRFINDQLYPAYSKIGSRLLIDFVPYGKAIQHLVDDEWSFECQHGEPECVGNRYQACGLALNKHQDKEVEYVNCLMGSFNASSVEALQNCAPKLGIHVQDILTCSGSKQGDDLLAKLGDRTHEVQPLISFVPTIHFNGKYDGIIQESVLKDFFKTACEALDNKPQGCQGKCY